eukprot:6104110-Pleurochrysis_carterae.AAC.4
MSKTCAGRLRVRRTSMPMEATSGMMTMAATVWLTTTESPKTAAVSCSVRIQGDDTSSEPVRPLAIAVSNPLSFTASPSVLPPAMRASRCHETLLKSSLVRKPEPKATTRRRSPTSAGSPKTARSGGHERRAHSTMVVSTAPSMM